MRYVSHYMYVNDRTWLKMHELWLNSLRINKSYTCEFHEALMLWFSIYENIFDSLIPNDNIVEHQVTYMYIAAIRDN